MKKPRVAILGFAIESNRFAPISTGDDFRARAYLEGEELIEEVRKETPRTTPEIPAFVRRMDETGEWTAVPILFANAESGGPVDHAFFSETLTEIEHRLRAAMPLDAVYICEHGAAITTQESDPDGVVFESIREIVGPAVPVVATVDLHANVSDRMVDAVDVLVSYRRNPHTDMAERGAEAADLIHELLSGVKPVVAHVRLPIISPPTQLLTAPGTGPYAEMIERGEALDDPRLLNVSVAGGFSYGDTPKNGLTVLVTCRQDQAYAEKTAKDLASIAWEKRAAFYPELIPLEQAVEIASAAGRDDMLPPVLLADVADNPGGGGRGNTTTLLRALVEARVKGAILGVFTDQALAAEAHRLGVGSSFRALFNRDETARFSEQFEADATVVKLHSGKGVGRRGQLAGCSFDLGPTAVLEIEGIRVVVITHRHQCHEPMFFEMCGIDIGTARSVVLKSRGHFRAAFDEFFTSAQILHVDAPGLTSPALNRFDFKHLPRPAIPLDDLDDWNISVRMKGAHAAAGH
ncbi:M81 family metallopeptidase [bacterium BD-1]|nr:M81 family metallopeptidase [Ottowia caeni]